MFHRSSRRAPAVRDPRRAFVLGAVTAVCLTSTACLPDASPKSAASEDPASYSTIAQVPRDAGRAPGTTPALPPPATEPPVETAAPETVVPETEAPETEAETAGTGTTGTGTTGPRPPVAAAPPPAVGAGAPLAGLPDGAWLSGASGTGAATGEFGAWRGRSLEIGGTWADNNQDQVGIWALKEEWAHWDGAIDIAIGAIGPGETWQAAAAGAYDGRWRQSLTNLRAERGSRPGTLFIRFAHESNGNWYPWSVDAGEVDAFRAAWQRFRALQQEIYPASQLVFNVNRESIGSGVDWRRTFPGAQYVDVMSVDYYNQWPTVTSPGQWAGTLDDVDGYGAPKGLEQHRLFAESVGLPLAISEWSGNADQGGSAAFMEAMYSYLAEHAGSGPGELLYEILFNVEGYSGTFYLFGNGVRMPETAEAYRRMW